MHRAGPGAAPPSRRWAEALTRSWARPQPDALARALRPLAALYRAAWTLREAAYNAGWRAPERLPVPVLVVGNLVAGGAGKTPTVLALLPKLQALGFEPGVVSRGHGRAAPDQLVHVTANSLASDVGDEPLLIHLRSGAPVVVAADRVAAGRALCARHPEVNLLVADDGLQHRRLARDAQVVVFDDRGVGNGLLLPAGPLRQPMLASPPPASTVLYTGGRASTAWPGHTGRRRLSGVWPLDAWWQGAATRTLDATADPWAALRGRPVLAAAGLARPDAFFTMLEAQGLQLQRWPLPDHAPLQPLPWPADAADVVITEKDAVKLPAQAARGTGRIWVATLDFQTAPGFDAELARLCTPFLPSPPTP